MKNLSPLGRHCVILVLFPLCAYFVTGCAEGSLLDAQGQRVAVGPPGTISVYELAGHVGLYVAETSEYCATLRNSANTVTLFKDPGGAVYINGEPVTASSSGVVSSSGMLFAPQNLEGVIRSRLRGPQMMGLVKLPPNKNPYPTPETPRPSTPLGKVHGRVVIDAGHGGKDPGTTIACHGCGREKAESTITLALALVVIDRLKQYGVDVIPTRRDNTFVELDERSAIANRSGADLFVSIHCDCIERDPSVHGFRVYTARSPSSTSLSLAKTVDRHMSAAGANSRGLGEAGYKVLVHTTCPAILIETCCLSNSAEANRMIDPSYQTKLAYAIADGIAESLQRK